MSRALVLAGIQPHSPSLVHSQVMDAMERVRDCGGDSFTSFVRSLIDWHNSIFGGGLCSGVTRKVRGLCLPAYVATDIEDIEDNRDRMALALAGQFTVVVLRVMTGHIGGGLVGLAIFVAGNQARCSLQHMSLSSFVALGFTVGTLDAVGFLQRLSSLGMGSFMLPIQDNFFLDVTTISSVMAPIAEMTCARLAWDSYLPASAFFHISATPWGGNGQPPIQGITATDFNRPWWSRPRPDEAYRLQPFEYQPRYNPALAASMVKRVPPRGAVQAASFFATGVSEADEYGGWCNAPVKGQYQAVGFPPSYCNSGDGGNAASSIQAVRDRRCSQCDGALDVGSQKSHGTGLYANEDYCRQCWQDWTCGSDS